MDKQQLATLISEGKAVLGMELGSTRIKAVLVDENHAPIASGNHDWENRFENGFWTYSLDLIHKGLKGCFKSLKEDVLENVLAGKIKLETVSNEINSNISADFLSQAPQNRLSTGAPTYPNRYAQLWINV